MNLFQRIGAAIGVLRGTVSMDPFTLTRMMEAGFGGSTENGVDGRAWCNSYNRRHRLRGVVSRISRDVGRQRWFVGKRDSNDRLQPIRDPKNPLVALLKNPWVIGYGGTWAELVALTQVYMELLGERFLAVSERDGEGRPLSIFPLPPFFVADLPSKKSATFRLHGPIPTLTGETSEIPEWDVFYGRTHNAANPFGRGAGQAWAVDDEVVQGEIARKFVTSYFRNSARPDLVAFVKGVTVEQADDLTRDWTAQHRGMPNSHKVKVFNAEGRIEKIGHNLADLAITELEHELRDAIWQNWQVPPEIMGAIENSNRANAEAADYHYASKVLEERCESFAQWFNLYITPEFYGNRRGNYELGYISPVRETEEFRLSKAVKLYEVGLITRNEGRAEWNFAPDPTKLGDAYNIPKNMNSSQDSLPAPAEAKPTKKSDHKTLEQLGDELLGAGEELLCLSCGTTEDLTAQA